VLDVLEHRLIEALAAREADVAQRLLEVLGLDVLVALDLGRSSTATTSTLPSRRSSTSRKNFVAYSDLTASATRRESSASPMFTGR
jgi:hypothetical protein